MARKLARLAITAGTTLLIGTGCGAVAPAGQQPTIQPQATATISSFFTEPPTQTPYQAQAPTTAPVVTVAPTSPTAATQLAYKELAIYDENMLAGWTLRDSSMDVDEVAGDYAHDGMSSLSASPTDGYTTLQFSVTKQSKERYERDNILGISFWISGGVNEIAPEDLVVSVLGSNDNPHWVAGDTSALPPGGRLTGGEPLFAETRFYYLGFNRPIPAGEWVEVVVWLDELSDPPYSYLTAFYIKNDEAFQQTFYVDRVSLLVAKE